MEAARTSEGRLRSWPPVRGSDMIEKGRKVRQLSLLSVVLVSPAAVQKGFDVFNALDLMENKAFLEKLKFGIGDGNLQYYLYNWKCPSMGAEKVGTQPCPPRSETGSGIQHQSGPLLTGVGPPQSPLPPMARLAGSVFPFQQLG